MRQNVDFAPTDVPAHNPSLAPGDVLRRLSIAHSLAGGQELIADQQSRVSASSYCQLSRMMCENHGGTYMSPDGACTEETRGQFDEMLRLASVPRLEGWATETHPSNVSGSAMQTRIVPATAELEYERYWNGRTNIDSVDSSSCGVPCSVGSFVGGYGHASGVAHSAAVPADVSSQCYRACVSNQGGQTTGCDLLCATQPQIPSSGASVLPSNLVPRSVPFGANLPVGVAMSACLDQCTATGDPFEQQVCRLACTSLTGSPAELQSAAGGCMDGCLASCGGATDCAAACEGLCSGQTMESALTSARAPISF